MTPLLIAHRGDAINYPENSIGAFQSAFNNGADGIELDTQLDHNGNVIVVHDYLFDRNKSYPLLTEVLEQFQDKGRLEIEIKSPIKESVNKIAELIKKLNPPDYELTSSIMPHLPEVKRFLPEAKIGLIFKTSLIEEWMQDDYINKLLIGYLELTKANILHLPINFYNETNSSLFHSMGFILHGDLGANTLDYRKAVELEIDQCTIDDVNVINKLKSSNF